MERLLLLPMLALLAASAAAAPSLERLTELAATAPYGDPEGDAARAALADNTLAYSAKRWEGGVPPAVTEAGPHATVEHAAPGEAPTVPARGVEGPDAGATDSELEALTESDVGAPDGECVGGREGGEEAEDMPHARVALKAAPRGTHWDASPFTCLGRETDFIGTRRGGFWVGERVCRGGWRTVSSRRIRRARARHRRASEGPTHPVPPHHTTH